MGKKREDDEILIHREPKVRAPRDDLRKHQIKDPDVERDKKEMKRHLRAQGEGELVPEAPPSAPTIPPAEGTPVSEGEVPEDAAAPEKPLSLFDDQDKMGQVKEISGLLGDAWDGLSEAQFHLGEGGLDSEKQAIIDVMNKLGEVTRGVREKFKIAGNLKDLQTIVTDFVSQMGSLHKKSARVRVLANKDSIKVVSINPEGEKTFAVLQPAQGGFTVADRSYDRVPLLGEGGADTGDLITDEGLRTRLGAYFAQWREKVQGPLEVEAPEEMPEEAPEEAPEEEVSLEEFASKGSSTKREARISVALKDRINRVLDQVAGSLQKRSPESTRNIDAVQNELDALFESEVQEPIAQPVVTKTVDNEEVLTVRVTSSIKLAGETDEHGFKVPNIVTTAGKGVWGQAVQRLVDSGRAYCQDGTPDYGRVIDEYKALMSN